MNLTPSVRYRKAIRLKGYDYSQAGGYFVTIVAWRRECLFGEIVDEEMRLNPFGEIVNEEWSRSAEIRREIALDAFVVMPNHIHGIIFIHDDSVGATGRSPLPPHDKSRYPHGPAPKSLGAFVAGFKSSVTKRINLLDNAPGAPVWQRNYVSRALCGAMNTLFATNPITNVLPITSPSTRLIGLRTRKTLSS